MRLHRCFGVTVLLLTCAGASALGAMLSGSVSFDSTSNLYTYSYVVDNTFGLAPINTIDIFVNSHQIDYSFAPVSTTSPAGFIFDGVSAGCGSPLFENPCATAWGWFDGIPGGVPVGSVLGGFSFTTPVAPTTNNYTNYGLFALTLPNAVVGSGHIVAPEEVPEPVTAPLVACVLMVLAGGKYWTRSRSFGSRVRCQGPVLGIASGWSSGSWAPQLRGLLPNSRQGVK